MANQDWKSFLERLAVPVGKMGGHIAGIGGHVVGIGRSVEELAAVCAGQEYKEPELLIPPMADPVSAHEQAKQQLLVTLQANEWNVAVVARKFGVMRRTIYLRMQRYGIERKKVPRTMKKMAR